MEKKIVPAVRDAIELYMRTNHYTMDDLAEKLGVSQQAVSVILSRGFGLASSRRWASTFGFSSRFLMTGEGSLMNENTVESGDVVGADSERYVTHVVPLLPVLAQAGHLSDFADAISQYDCERIISPIKGADLAVPIYGESMYPDFPNGSIVFVKRIHEDAFIEWGKAYILDTQNGSVIKYLAPSEKDGFIKCISANHDPRYAPFEISVSDIRAIFKVVMCMSMK